MPKWVVILGYPLSTDKTLVSRATPNLKLENSFDKMLDNHVIEFSIRDTKFYILLY